MLSRKTGSELVELEAHGTGNRKWPGACWDALAVVSRRVLRAQEAVLCFVQGHQQNLAVGGALQRERNSAW